MNNADIWFLMGLVIKFTIRVEMQTDNRVLICYDILSFYQQFDCKNGGIYFRICDTLYK